MQTEEEKYRELEEGYVDLAKEVDDLQSEYGALLEQLKWTHAMLSILIEEQGGVVQVARNVIDGYPLDTQIKVYEDVEGSTFIIEVVREEDE